MVKIRLIQDLEHLRRDEHEHDPGVGAESTAKKKDREPDHQEGGQLETTDFSDRLEHRVQRFAPQARHSLLHVLVQGVKHPGRDRHREPDVRDRERGGGDEPRP